MGEWGRAACFFLPNVALGIAALSQAGIVTNAQGSRIYYTDGIGSSRGSGSP